MRTSLSHPIAKLTLLVLAWAYFHHFLAGIRHLAMDLHIGMDLPAARKSGAFVLVLALVLTVAVAVKLW
jgi:succinate dehydrogenase / fumarate reductase cytochrome b subunit